MLSPGLVAFLAAPALSAVVLFWHGSQRYARVLAWFMLALSTAWATGLLASGATAAVGSVPGPMGSTASWTLAGTSGVLAVLAGWLVVVYLSPLGRPLEDGPPARVATCLLLLSAVLSALTVDDLLVRVIFLDLGSIVVCALLLYSVVPSARLSALWNYALLMLGDLAFLAVALLLHANAGTWRIDAALREAVGAPPAIRWAILGTGLLAAWVKMALPPLGGWLRAFEHRRGVVAVLVASAGPPLLGAYLLYRLQPLLRAMNWPATALILGALALSGAFVLSQGIRSRDDWATAQSWHALLGLGLSLSSAFPAYLLSFVPIRAALSVALQAARQPAVPLASQADGVPSTLARIASLAAHEDNLWTRALAGGVHAALTRARAAALAADERGHRALENTVLTMMRAGAWLSRHHAGKLRRSLLWALLGLIPVLLVLFLTAWEV
jgi:formate hydrogenlyase subunit 3/multisubunit Na+/H+ antiporter MnhD subunit